MTASWGQEPLKMPERQGADAVDPIPVGPHAWRIYRTACGVPDVGQYDQKPPTLYRTDNATYFAVKQ